ncbi:MAG: beta-L-arabinofuranosidase domain-containing protein [Armatimonadota bacterium]
MSRIPLPPVKVLDRVAPRWKDVLAPLPTEAVRVEGWLGRRIDANADRRLLEADEDGMLAGFKHRPGAQAWIGEHAGKFLHAASLATRNRRLPALAAKRDRVARALIAAQEPDGYLGTYLPDQRFGLFPNADWDVWVHKYCLIGLLAWHEATGDPAGLATCVRAADLLLRAFPPGGKRLASAGTHVGMAATSVLEPLVLLHRRTGEGRFLEFARRIVDDWNLAGGPGIAASLKQGKGVEGTANGKAYEMLSNLVGLCELARTTGDRSLLDPVRAAWTDIVNHHRYLTGSMSRHEHFGPDHELPNAPDANVGETCVTTTWLQLNALMLRMTGDIRHGDEIERALWNHLAAAQRPDGAQWCYYTALEGTKPYGPGINCCVSSGPRAMALAPSLAVLRSANGVVHINFPESLVAEIQIDGVPVRLRQTVRYEAEQVRVALSVEGRPGKPLAVRWRVPEWLRGGVDTDASGWATFTVGPTGRSRGDVLGATIGVRRMRGSHGNTGKDAYQFGPWVLAAVSSPEAPPPWRMRADSSPVRVAAPGAHRLAMIDRMNRTWIQKLVAFADAGAQGERYAVWLPDPSTRWPAESPSLSQGEEMRSRPGNVQGSILDGDPRTIVVTFDGARQVEAWFGVELDLPVSARTFLYRHGHAFHDGGWFVGSPRVEIKERRDGPWVGLGTFPDWPATTMRSPADLADGRLFRLRLATPRTFVALRVVGVPASGDQERISFASCAEIGVEP